MGKTKIGSVNHLTLVKGDVNLLKQGEILVDSSEEYTVLRKRDSSGKIKNFVIIPLEDFNPNSQEKVNQENIPIAPVKADSDIDEDNQD